MCEAEYRIAALEVDLTTQTQHVNLIWTFLKGLKRVQVQVKKIKHPFCLAWLSVAQWTAAG